MSAETLSERPWVLITGASYGLGEVYARRFAREGWNVVLTARSVERLETIAKAIRESSSALTCVIPMDLTRPEAVSLLKRAIDEQGIIIEGLVNNAGFGKSGKFADISRDFYLSMVDVHVRAFTELTHVCLEGMLKRDKGLIINICSLVGFTPLPYGSVYAATKAYMLSLSESLWLELRGTGIRVLNVCPGLTKTNFGNVWDNKDFRKNSNAETPEKVVDNTFRALRKGMPTMISGWKNQLLISLSQAVPRRLMLEMVNVVQRVRKGVG